MCAAAVPIKTTEKALNNGEVDFGFENPPVYVRLNTHEAIAIALQGAEGDRYAGGHRDPQRQHD
jgi:hypothetical protein